MKTILLSILLCIISYPLFSQTFKVTDYKTTGISLEETQEKKQKALGAKIELTFYDSSVKMTTYKKDGSVDSEIVLDKIKDEKDTYIVKVSKNRKAKLVLKKTLAYINSATWTAYKYKGEFPNRKLVATIEITLKRN